MSQRAPFVPDGVPVLSRGRHRNPRKGACFMEMASFLAGERWSDHPSCTHPVLATLARCVNDMLDDTSRQRISTMIPEVVGLNPHDDRVSAALVLSSGAGGSARCGRGAAEHHGPRDPQRRGHPRRA